MKTNSFPKLSGIYSFSNLITGSIYIGQSTNLERRIKQHLRDLRADRDYSAILQRAWNKYGEENFEIKIIELCDEKDLDEKEIYFISEMKSLNTFGGYNISPGGGVMRGVYSPNYGKKISKEQINKMMETRKNYRPSEETKRKVSKSLMGHVVTQETRDKISKAQIGKKTKPMAEETKKKISKANKGRKFDEDFGKKISYINIGKKSKNPSSKYKGVSKSKHGNKYWAAQIQINGSNKKIGRFYTEMEAAIAYDEFVWEKFTDLSKLNFPDKKWTELENLKTHMNN